MFHIVKVTHFLMMSNLARHHQEKIVLHERTGYSIFFIRSNIRLGIAYETSEKIFRKCNMPRSFMSALYPFSTLDTVKFTQTCYCNMNHVKDIMCNFTCQVQIS